MFLRKALGLVLTALIFAAAIIGGRALWFHYMDEPWTRDGRVRADVINVAPDVSGAVVAMPVVDNQFVHKGDLVMQIDPSHYRIAVEAAEATVAQRKTELQMRRDDAQRRADMDSEVVSRENRENASQTAAAAAAQLQQAEAALDAARLNLERGGARGRICHQPQYVSRRLCNRRLRQAGDYRQPLILGLRLF
jgi:multidrug resistance efflux pump